MKKFVPLISIICALLAPAAARADEPVIISDLKITVLSTMLTELRGVGEWGFAALIEADGHTVLFDTGERPDTVLKNAKELLMLGSVVGADEALRMGLVNRVVPVDDVFEEAAKVAKQFAALPPRGVRLNKFLVNRVYELQAFREALDYRDDPVIQALSEDASGDTVGTWIGSARKVPRKRTVHT